MPDLEQLSGVPEEYRDEEGPEEQEARSGGENKEEGEGPSVDIRARVDKLASIRQEIRDLYGKSLPQDLEDGINEVELELLKELDEVEAAERAKKREISKAFKTGEEDEAVEVEGE